jgi:hemerythrin superfamily protein
MHGLARAIGILRDLMNNLDPMTLDEGMRVVREAVLEVQNRLTIHNELEESQVYRLAETILTEQEQAELATRISAELAKLPPRFSQTPGSIQQVI